MLQGTDAFAVLWPTGRSSKIFILETIIFFILTQIKCQTFKCQICITLKTFYIKNLLFPYCWYTLFLRKIKTNKSCEKTKSDHPSSEDFSDVKTWFCILYVFKGTYLFYWQWITSLKMWATQRRKGKIISIMGEREWFWQMCFSRMRGSWHTAISLSLKWSCSPSHEEFTLLSYGHIVAFSQIRYSFLCLACLCHQCRSMSCIFTCFQ